MSDESGPVLNEQTQKQDSGASETNNQPQSDKPTHQKVSDYQRSEGNKRPRDDIPNWKLYGGIGGGVLAIILSMVFFSSGNTGLGLIFLSLPIIGPLVLTEGGREILKEMQEEMEDENQIQKKSTQSKPKRICSECGWQNPQENSYCNDCGSELSNSG